MGGMLAWLGCEVTWLGCGLVWLSCVLVWLGVYLYIWGHVVAWLGLCGGVVRAVWQNGWVCAHMVWGCACVVWTLCWHG